MAKVIMVQGTMSNAGKSLIVAGLCRIFAQDGYRVAPFKSQNMALNSYITEDGLEMGRAQVIQAEAAGVKPSVLMNPILLKPTNDVGSQVIVKGEVLGNMRARDYFAYKKKLIPTICEAFSELEKQADIIVMEGAGSPAEINLKSDDIVNMGLAKLVDAPVLLVGDIDRGGVFAQLLGTLMLLEEDEKARVKGLIINKFRGDKTILDPGVKMLEERGGVKVAGVVPYMHLSIEDEDSLSGQLDNHDVGVIDLAVIRFPRISNFTDFSPLESHPALGVRYVERAGQLGEPDLVVLPGTKNTMGDLAWMRQNGLEAAVKKLAAAGTPVLGGLGDVYKRQRARPCWACAAATRCWERRWTTRTAWSREAAWTAWAFCPARRALPGRRCAPVCRRAPLQARLRARSWTATRSIWESRHYVKRCRISPSWTVRGRMVQYMTTCSEAMCTDCSTANWGPGWYRACWTGKA